MDYTAAVDLEVLCESREGYRVVYEDLCPKSHWPDIFSLRPADVPKHPLYRTKRCKHGSATKCPMQTMCVFAHTDEELRPRPGQGDQEFSFKLRLMHGATELFSCENHGTFRSKNRAKADVAAMCLDYIEGRDGQAGDAPAPPLPEFAGLNVVGDFPPLGGAVAPAPARAAPAVAPVVRAPVHGTSFAARCVSEASSSSSAGNGSSAGSISPALDARSPSRTPSPISTTSVAAGAAVQGFSFFSAGGASVAESPVGAQVVSLPQGSAGGSGGGGFMKALDARLQEEINLLRLQVKGYHPLAQPETPLDQFKLPGLLRGTLPHYVFGSLLD